MRASFFKQCLAHLPTQIGEGLRLPGSRHALIVFKFVTRIVFDQLAQLFFEHQNAAKPYLRQYGLEMLFRVPHFSRDQHHPEHRRVSKVTEVTCHSFRAFCANFQSPYRSPG